MEPLILETVSGPMNDKKVIRTSQHEFTKKKSCFTILMNFCDEVIGLVERAVNIVYLIFTKAFDTVSHKTLIDKFLMHGLDE